MVWHGAPCHTPMYLHTTLGTPCPVHGRSRRHRRGAGSHADGIVTGLSPGQYWRVAGIIIILMLRVLHVDVDVDVDVDVARSPQIQTFG